MFNVKIKRFYDTEQIQIFSQGMHSKGEVEKEKKVDPFTGEVLKHNRKYVVSLNPFDEDFPAVVECEPDTKESARISASRTIHKIYDIARSNYWEWFLTFTFSPEKVKDRKDYDELSVKLSNWLKRMRKVCPDMVYLVVPEQHKDGAYHFHGLFANIDALGLVDSGTVDKDGNTVYNVGSYKFGFTTAERIRDLGRSCSYLSKYITKDLCTVTKGKRRYWSSRNVKLPVVEELHFEVSTDERIRMFMKGSTYMKSVQTTYTDVTYIERSLTDAPE